MAMNNQALDNYGKLTEYEKEELIAHSKEVKSKEEMQQLLNSWVIKCIKNERRVRVTLLFLQVTMLILQVTRRCIEE